MKISEMRHVAGMLHGKYISTDDLTIEIQQNVAFVPFFPGMIDTFEVLACDYCASAKQPKVFNCPNCGAPYPY